MEDENDLWNVLTDLADDCHLAPARPDASTVLLSLPVELLQEIAEYCKFSDIHSLSTVCKQLHAVAVYRLYTTVALHVGRFISEKMQSTLDDGEQATDHFLRLCAISAPRRGGILCGLLARQEHLNALRTLIICDVPESSSSAYRRHADVVLRDVVSRAQGLQHIFIPPLVYDENYHADTSVDQYCPSLELKDYQWPDSLRSLQIDFLPSNGMDLWPLLGQISSLVVRHPAVVTGNHPLESVLGLNLRHLDCRFYFIQVDGTTNSLDSICNFVTALSQLETLAIGLKGKDDAIWSQAVNFVSPVSASPTSYSAVADHLMKTIVDAYISIAGKLKHLRGLKIHRFAEGGHYSFKPRFTLEHSTILRLTKASQSLEWVTLRVPYLYDLKEPNVKWKRCVHPEAEEGAIWLPDPAVTQRWKTWFEEYDTPELVERRMHQFWGKERLIPSLLYLQSFTP